MRRSRASSVSASPVQPPTLSSIRAVQKHFALFPDSIGPSAPTNMPVTNRKRKGVYEVADQAEGSAGGEGPSRSTQILRETTHVARDGSVRHSTAALQVADTNATGSAPPDALRPDIRREEPVYDYLELDTSEALGKESGRDLRPSVRSSLRV